MNRYQKAGQISAEKSRNKSLENYYKNPNVCKSCGCVIKVDDNQKVSEVRKKQFCNQSCNATFNNKIRYRETEPKKEKNVRPERYSYFEGVTKKNYLDTKGIYYKFRAEIRKHAQWIYQKNNGNNTCKVCGYNKHIQVCHIKSVSSFNDDNLITDINSFDNLIGLCPNHHWEYDNGYLVL
jgi:predicted restriction endonuclease